MIVKKNSVGIVIHTLFNSSNSGINTNLMKPICAVGLLTLSRSMKGATGRPSDFSRSLWKYKGNDMCYRDPTKAYDMSTQESYGIIIRLSNWWKKKLVQSAVTNHCKDVVFWANQHNTKTQEKNVILHSNLHEVLFKKTVGPGLWYLYRSNFIWNVTALDENHLELINEMY